MKSLKRILCMILCLCMTFGALTVLSSCNRGEETPQTTTDPNEGKVSVVRALEVLAAGTRIERKYFEEVMVDADTVPEGAYASIKDVANKFLQTAVYPGDVLVTEKVGKTKNDTTDNIDHAAGYDEYVIITDHIESLAGDLSDAIQKVVDENPNKTIYFPEGKYNIKKPIVTSADPAKCVSFKLATHAVITAMAGEWKAEDALFVLGGKDEVATHDADYSFVGGVLQCEDLCNAIIVESGDVLINNVSIKKNHVGITIRENARAHVDSCVVVGPGGANKEYAIGVLMEGEESTLTNMRMAGNRIGVKLTGSNNVLRNIHPLTGGDMITSSAFWDASDGGNFFDTCYSDQFADSFRIGEKATSIYISCFAMWYQSESGGTIDKPGGNHYGFKVEGQFNSVVMNTRIAVGKNQHEKCDCAYLMVAEEGGTGVVVYPRMPGHVDVADTPDEHFNDPGGLGKYVKTAILG